MNKDIENLMNTINHFTRLTFLEHSNQLQQNTHYFEVHMKHSSKDHILHYKTNLNKFKGLKLFKVCSQIMTELSRNQLEKAI